MADVSRKTVENVLLTLSSVLRTARAWDYACGNFKFSDLTLPREGVKKEQRCFSDEEMGRIIAAAPEPFGTILTVTSVLGLRVGEVLALRVSDVDLARRIIRVRQTVDAATRTVQGVKSRASNADLPMPSHLEARLRKHLQSQNAKSDLLFSNRDRRPFSANKLREKQLHPLLKKLGIPRGGFHSMRHGAASSLLADGATPAVVQRQLRHSDARITLGIYGQPLTDHPGQPLLSEKRVLRAWLAERHDASDFVFTSQKGGGIHRSQFFRMFQSVAERAGLPADRRHPHCLKRRLWTRCSCVLGLL